MKKSNYLKITIALLLFIVFKIEGKSQIQILETSKKVEVGKLKAGYITIAELSYKVDSKDTVYTILYRNGKYTQIDSYEALVFSSEGNTLGALYDLMHKAFEVENPKEYEVTIKLANETLVIKGYKAMGVKGVQFLTTKGWLVPISQNQLDKLFGR